MPSGSDWHSKKIASKKRWNPRPSSKGSNATASSTVAANERDVPGRGRKSRGSNPGGRGGGSTVAADHHNRHIDTNRGGSFSRRRKTDNSHRYESRTNGFSFRVDGRQDEAFLQAISDATSPSEEKVAARPRSQPRSRLLTHLTATERELASLQFLRGEDAVACANEAARSYNERTFDISKLGLAYLLDIDDESMGFKAQWDGNVGTENLAKADGVSQSNGGAAEVHKFESPRTPSQSFCTREKVGNGDIQTRTDATDGDVDAMIGAGGGSRPFPGIGVWKQEASVTLPPSKGNGDADIDALLALDVGDGGDNVAKSSTPPSSGSVHSPSLDSVDGDVDALLALDTGAALDDASSSHGGALVTVTNSASQPAAQKATVDALLGGTRIQKGNHVRPPSPADGGGDDDVDALLNFSSTASTGFGVAAPASMTDAQALNAATAASAKDDADADVDALLGL